MQIKEMLAPVIPKGARSGQALSGFIGVTIHNTGNYSKGAGAENQARYLQGVGSNIQVSWHYAVDDRFIVRCVPEKEVTWNCANDRGNRNTVSIEICVNPECNLKAATFNAAYIAARVLYEHGIRKAVWKQNTFQHNDWNGKDCPHELRSGQPMSWGDFVGMVNWFLSEMTPDQNRHLKLRSFQKMDQATAERIQKVLISAGFDSVIEEI